MYWMELGFNLFTMKTHTFVDFSFRSGVSACCNYKTIVSSQLPIYKYFISSTFDYCPVAWIFCGKTNSNKLDKLNKRAIRIVSNDHVSSYSIILVIKYDTLNISIFHSYILYVRIPQCGPKYSFTFETDIKMKKFFVFETLLTEIP